MDPRIVNYMHKEKERIPEWIMQDVRQRLGYEPDDTSHDDEIYDTMTPREIFEEWLSWNGILGCHDRILKAIHSIFGVDLGY